MPTLGQSPEVTSVLHDIKPTEVSAVDMPANGEPMIIVKGMSESNRLDTNLKDDSEPVYDSSNSDVKEETAKKQGGPEMKPKLDETHVPRQVMKVVQKRVSRIVDDIVELQDVIKNLKVAEDGSAKAPVFLTDMAKSISADLRSLLPDNEVSVEKRGVARSVMSLQKVTKQVEDREKANAVSYLVRDRYVSVAQSMSEYLTTYVQGIESDDSGPKLIPDDLDSTVEKSANELDVVVAETEEKDETQETDVQKQFGAELIVGKVDMTVQEAFDRIMKAIENKSPSQVVGGDGGTVMETETKETTTETVADTTNPTEEQPTTPETPVPVSADAAPTAESVPVEEPATKGKDEPILAAIAAMEKKFDNQFEQVRTEIKDVRGVATSASEKVDKALRSRVDSRGGQVDKTTKVEPTEKREGGKDEGSFAPILGLPRAE